MIASPAEAQVRYRYGSSYDFDRDGVPNYRDRDDDNDGIRDSRDRNDRTRILRRYPTYRYRVGGWRQGWRKDRDRDGIRNRWDRDKDGDGRRNRRDDHPRNPRRR
jgi:hypothetical protein